MDDYSDVVTQRPGDLPDEDTQPFEPLPEITSPRKDGPGGD